MAAIHETREVSVTLEAPPIAPLFIPMITLDKGDIIIPSQCTLTVSGVPTPLEVAVMLCVPGTELGTTDDAAVLQVANKFNAVADKPFALEGNVPPLEQGGVVGLSVPVQTLQTGAKIVGTLSVVR